MRRFHRPMHLDELETRWVPATIRVVGGTLIVSNPTIVGGATKVEITRIVNGFEVEDASKTITVRGVSSVVYRGTNVADKVTLNLDGETMPGSFLASTGNGNDNVSVLSTSIGGELRGNVSINAGFGLDVVRINEFNLGTLDIAGSVQVISKAGNDLFSMDGISLATEIGGNLVLVGVPRVDVGTVGNASIGGSLVIRNDFLSTPSDIEVGGSDVVGNTTIGKSLVVSTGSGDDSLQFEDVILNATGGSTRINTGAGDDVLVMEPGSGDGTNVLGDFSLTMGAGDDDFNVIPDASSPVILQGDVSVDMGGGDNGVNASLTNFTIFGDVSFLLGDGDNLVDFSGATLGGTLSFQLGNGNNSTTIGDTPGGSLSYRSGNGNNTLTLSPTSSGAWDAFILFGTGSDTLDLTGSDAQTLFGTVDFGGPSGGNTLTQGANWTLGSIQLLNV